ncbi:MAG TPA: hydroxysqualene dehydroxylase HpnE [Terriglobales bacterium]|nr:hydroxysqualene dehydroxylase HpnE [Terriglobales bacterium]
MTNKEQHATVGIVGGGIAGLAAGCALADAGFRISLFERRPFVGGRASSYEHPGTGEIVDNCQHVLLGCCTNLLDFYRRIGAVEKIRWFDRLTFIEPGGRRSEIGPSGLPAPLHTALSFLRASSLSWADKISISRAMLALMGPLPPDSPKSFADWLREHHQTHGAIDRFWKVVLVSAINEDLDRISVRYGAQVFRESFLKSAEAGKMGVPTVPLSDLYSKAISYIEQRNGKVHLRTSVEGVVAERESVVLQSSGTAERFDFVVLAVPHNALGKLLPSQNGSGETSTQLQAQIAKFESSPITGIHLWFDREITDLHHAVLLDRTIQWMFQKSKLQPQRQGAEQAGSYIELVVSSSKSLVGMGRQEILDLALRELAEFFPRVREAQLLKSTVVKEVHATYSALPGSDSYRPQSRTPWPRVFLAGDWTATGWPATMEGAVRSGYRAAQALAESDGANEKFLVSDLRPAGLMRFVGE